MNISGKLSLSRKVKVILQKFAHTRKGSRGLALRSKVILLWHQGVSIRQSTQELGLARDTVRLWRTRWKQGMERSKETLKTCKPSKLGKKLREVLSDAPRSGAPVKFEAEVVCEIIALACKLPANQCVPVSHWSARNLREEVIAQNIVKEISTRSIGRFLKKVI